MGSELPKIHVAGDLVVKVRPGWPT